MIDIFQQLQLSLSLIAIIISYFVGRYYNKKSESQIKRITMSERSRIKTNYSNQLAEQIVKSLLNGEESNISIERIKANINGKLITQDFNYKELSDEEANDVINNTISLIDEQKYITSDIKEKAINSLFNVSKAIKGNMRDKQKYHRFLSKRKVGLLDEDYAYIVSIISVIIILTFLGISIFGLDSLLLYIFSWISVIILTYTTLINFQGFVLIDTWRDYLKAHAFVNAILFMIAFVGIVISTEIETLTEEPLLPILIIAFQTITWLLPFTTTATFIYLKLQENKTLNASNEDI